MDWTLATGSVVDLADEVILGLGMLGENEFDIRVGRRFGPMSFQFGEHPFGKIDVRYSSSNWLLSALGILAKILFWPGLLDRLCCSVY